jgi:Arylsulfotransferase (ASST)
MPRKQEIGPVERMLAARVSARVVLVLVILGVVCAICFGWLVKYHLAGGPSFYRLGALAVDFASVPSTLVALVRGRKPQEVTGVFDPEPDGFAKPGPANQFFDYLLVPRYVEGRDRYVVQLLQPPSNHVLKEYAPNVETIYSVAKATSKLAEPINSEHRRTKSTYHPTHPLLMDDGGIVFQDSGPLVRIDACSKVVWALDGVFHHSIERDWQGNLWIPYTPRKSKKTNVSLEHSDDGLAHVSPSGRLLSVTLLAGILKSNGLGYLFEGRPYLADPFHLNDIEPVLRSSRFWQQGDVFLSLRHMSLILLYRPSSGKVLWWKQGPWRMQHDVNILNDNMISIFDNRVISGTREVVDTHNSMLLYDFSTKNVDASWDVAFQKNTLKTITQGRSTPLDNESVFVEETEFGRLLQMSKDGTIDWKYFSANSKKQRLALSWSRILPRASSAQAVKTALGAACK